MTKFVDPDFELPSNPESAVILRATSILMGAIFTISDGNGDIALSIVGSLFASLLENSDPKGRIAGIKLLKDLHDSANERYQ
jgi:hypothetical protein